ncbi:hypothetical protein V6N12_011214 [Hibiscus sabdariffa]|uniref:Squalene monooxygenase n=1 Tax=Hibiscus sabdariffa TaxID=183260 RepID=A0ABR2EME7_9ROSI
MERIRSCRIPSKTLAPVLLGEAFIMDGSFKGCATKLLLFPKQGSVTSLLEEKGTIKGVQYRTKGGQELTAYAHLTIVCNGGFSNLRGFSYLELAKFNQAFMKEHFLVHFSIQVDVPSCFVGLVLENCELLYPNHGHVMLADPSPILFYPISSTEVRCLVDIPGHKVSSVSNGEMTHYMKTTVAPQVLLSLFGLCTS